VPLPRFRIRTLMIAVAVVTMALGAGMLLLPSMRLSVTFRKLVVVNQMGQPIPHLELTVLGETVILRSVPAGATVTASYPSLFGRFGQYDYFVAAGNLADGSQLDAGFRFPATGPNSYPTVLINPTLGFTVRRGWRPTKTMRPGSGSGQPK
jgi:hypothetical protein